MTGRMQKIRENVRPNHFMRRGGKRQYKSKSILAAASLFRFSVFPYTELDTSPGDPDQKADDDCRLNPGEGLDVSIFGVIQRDQEHSVYADCEKKNCAEDISVFQEDARHTADLAERMAQSENNGDPVVNKEVRSVMNNQN